MQTIRIKSITGAAPRYAHLGDAGFDCSFVVVDELEDTERGHKGYGSTGIQGDAR